MMSKFSILLVLTVFPLNYFNFLCGEYKNIKSEKRFLRSIRNPKYNLAVALFYDTTQKSIKDMFRETSRVFRYDDADLIFLAVNIGKKRSDVLADRYGVGRVPTFILFKDGLPYKNPAAKTEARITAFLERPQLETFIDNNFNKFIAQNRKRNAEIRKIKIQENLARPRVYWGWGWGYPYGGWGYPGWGYPYWGGYWRGGCYGGWRGFARRCR